MADNPIRRDLFAVKVFFDAGYHGAWCIERIFRRRNPAVDYLKGIEKYDHHRSYPLVRPKLVHPSQRTVDVFLLAGNEIW